MPENMRARAPKGWVRLDLKVGDYPILINQAGDKFAVLLPGYAPGAQGKTREFKTLAEAKAHADAKVSAEATRVRVMARRRADVVVFDAYYDTTGGGWRDAESGQSANSVFAHSEEGEAALRAALAEMERAETTYHEKLGNVRTVERGLSPPARPKAGG